MDTTVALNSRQGSTQKSDTVGATGCKEPMAQAGSMMSAVARWFQAETSLEITNGLLLAVVLGVGLVIGIKTGIRWDRSRVDQFSMYGKNYRMGTMSEVPNHPGYYIPVYQEVK